MSAFQTKLQKNRSIYTRDSFFYIEGTREMSVIIIQIHLLIENHPITSFVMMGWDL